MRIAAAAGSLVVVAALLTGCSTGPAASDDVVRATGTEPGGPLIPAQVSDLGAARIVDSIFAGLVTYAADGTADLDAAESIEASTDKSVFTVKLRGEQTFTDGAPVDAESFVKAWDWAADSANKAADQSAFRDIKGYVADKPDTPDVERSSLIEQGGLVVVDNRTFEIHLQTALADYPQRLGQSPFLPLPPAFFDNPTAFGEAPIGNGPYEIEGHWRHGEGIDLVVNDRYEGPRVPKNAGISLRFYADPDTAYVDVLSGFLDVIDVLPQSAMASYQDELGANALDVPGASLQSITIPYRLPHFGGAEGALRRAAISMAIDRDKVTDRVFDKLKIPAREFTAPIVAGYSDEIPGTEVLTFNDDSAKERWSEADTSKKATPWEGPLQIAYASAADKDWVAAVAESISRELGIDVEGVAYGSQEELDAAIADGSITTPFVTSQTAAYPGMLSFLGTTYVGKATNNRSGYLSKDFDNAMKAAALAGGPDDVVRSFKDAQRILLTDLPAIPLWYSSRQAGAGDRIAGLALDWDGVPRYFEITKRP